MLAQQPILTDAGYWDTFIRCSGDLIAEMFDPVIVQMEVHR